MGEITPFVAFRVLCANGTCWATIFPDVFKEYKKETPGCNGLSKNELTSNPPGNIRKSSGVFYDFKGNRNFV